MSSIVRDFTNKTKPTFSKNIFALSYVLFDLKVTFSFGSWTKERTVVPPAGIDLPTTIED